VSNAADMSNKPSSVTLPLSVACRMSDTIFSTQRLLNLNDCFDVIVLLP